MSLENLPVFTEIPDLSNYTFVAELAMITHKIPSDYPKDQIEFAYDLGFGVPFAHYVIGRINDYTFKTLKEGIMSSYSEQEENFEIKKINAIITVSVASTVEKDNDEIPVSIYGLRLDDVNDILIYQSIRTYKKGEFLIRGARDDELVSY